MADRYYGLDNKYDIKFTGGTWELLDQARNTSSSPGTRDTVDVTTRNDSGTVTLPGLFTPGTITVTLVYDPASTQHQALQDLAQDSSSAAIEIRQRIEDVAGTTHYQTIGCRVTGFTFQDDIGDFLGVEVEFTLEGTWVRT